MVQREQRREELASALRSHGALQSLDSDTLVYMAQWLYRRGEGKEQSFRALASVLDACAARLKAAQQRYAAPPVTGAGIQAPE